MVATFEAAFPLMSAILSTPVPAFMPSSNLLHRTSRQHFLFIACAVFSLANSARAEHASVQIPRFIPDQEYSTTREETASSLLWHSAPLTQSAKTSQPTQLELRQGIRAFLVADPALGQLYSLRQLVKGSSQRQWKISESSVGEIRLALGGQALPVFQLTGANGSRAAFALTNGNFGMYSTRPLSALNDGLKAADSTLGDAVSNDASQMDWLSARPFSSPRGTLDVVFLKGQNDLNPYSVLKTPDQFASGAMAGAKVAYLLPLRWKMNGEWITSGVKFGEDHSNETESPAGNSAYLLAFSGPIAHPFGETGVRFSYREVGANFQNFRGAPGDAGITSTQLSLSQPFEMGAISGEMELNWAQQLASNQSTPATGDNANLQAASSLRWQATPAVALTASHQIGSDVTTENAASTLLSAPIYNARLNSASQIGMEWRMTPRFSLSLNGGETRYDETSEGERFLRRLSNRDNQYSLGLRSQSSLASWNLQLERRAAIVEDRR